ncbi:hypothetical protein [Yoonia sp. R2-816]|uniref:hypothetical protein n=1 Tax=Yoonia sp. R2-816 TaxID=3342638 RepID=UPI003728D8C6
MRESPQVAFFNSVSKNSYSAADLGRLVPEQYTNLSGAERNRFVPVLAKKSGGVSKLMSIYVRNPDGNLVEVRN